MWSFTANAETLQALPTGSNKCRFRLVQLCHTLDIDTPDLATIHRA